MKALTLTPEWAWAVCHLDKRVENRSWAAPREAIGTTIALHAGKARPEWRAVELMAACAGWGTYGYARDFKRGEQIVNRPSSERFATGAIVATFRIVGCRRVREDEARGWEVGEFCWDIDDVVVLARPVPCKGALGLWTVPDALLGDVVTRKVA